MNKVIDYKIIICEIRAYKKKRLNGKLLINYYFEVKFPTINERLGPSYFYFFNDAVKTKKKLINLFREYKNNTIVVRKGKLEKEIDYE